MTMEREARTISCSVVQRRKISKSETTRNTTVLRIERPVGRTRCESKIWPKKTGENEAFSRLIH